MHLKPLLVASSLAAASLGSHAATTNWGTHAPLELGGAIAQGGLFDDTFEFTLGSNYLVTNSALTLLGTVAPATYSIFTVGADGLVGTADDAGLFAWTFGATTTVHTVTLGAGSYYYSVFGKALGQAVYAISSSITAVPPVPVPEPQTYAMLLAGLGVVGFLARRRRID